MASRMFDFPDPFRPVMALKCGSNLEKNMENEHVSFDAVDAVGNKHLPLNSCTMSVRLEAVHYHFLDVHDPALGRRQ
jgi:hypothetical protein